MAIGWFARIRTKLLIHSLVLSLLPLCLIGYIAYKNGEKALREKAFNHLSTAAILKEQEIIAWVEEKEGDIRLMAGLPSVAQKAVWFIRSRREDPERARIYTDLQAAFEQVVAHDSDFVELFLLEASRGQVILSTDREQEGKFKENRPYFREGKERPFTQDIYYSITTRRPAMTVSAPIIDETGPVAGVLVARINLAELDQIMGETTGLGRTGETYLVNKFNFFVSEARGSVGLPERKGNFTVGVKEALRGNNGSGLYENYKGVPVIGAYRWLPRQELALIAEMEQAEAFAPIRALRDGLILAGFLIIALMFAAVGGLTRAFTRPINTLVRGARAIGGGDLDHRIAVASRDELGYLAQAFNEMASTFMASRQMLEVYNQSLEIYNQTLGKKVAERTREISLLFETARYATSTLNLDEVLPMILCSAADLLNCHASTIRLLDQETKTLRLAADYNLTEAFKQRGDVPLGAGITGRAVLEDRPAVVEDLERDEQFIHKELALREGIRSLLAVPLHHGEAVIGVLNVYDGRPRHFSETEISSLSKFAHLAAIAIEKARLFQKTLQDAQFHKTLADLALTVTSTLDLTRILNLICEETTKLFRVDGSYLWTLDESGQELISTAAYGHKADLFVDLRVPISDPRSLAAKLVRERRASFINDVERSEIAGAPLPTLFDTKSVMAIPLGTWEKVVGALVLNDTHRTDRFDVEILQRTEIIATQAAIAIENARLYQGTVRQNQELAALHTIAVAVNQTLHLDALLQIALDKVQEVTGKAVAFIRTVDRKTNLLVLRGHRGLSPEYVKATPTITMGMGGTGYVLEQKRPLYVPNTSANPKMHRWVQLMPGEWSYFCAPMMAKGEVIGTLSVASDRPDDFTPEERRLIEAIAYPTGVAVENANLYQELRDYSATLEEKVRERTQELEIANQHKSEFLATMSHELRTPLNAVIGFSELLTDRLGPGLSDRHRRYLDNIHVSGRHLLDLINGILDLSKVESGRMDLYYEEVPFRELIQQVIAGVQPQADAKALTLSWQVEGGLDRVTLDAGKAKQILYNLLGNAVKFTPEGGQVRVAARLVQGSQQRDFVEISVQDTGIGVKPEDQARIFEPFQQIDSSLARKYPGTGLGLALTKKLVELHGGEIRLESTPGQGSTFTFTLALQDPTSNVQGPKSESLEHSPRVVEPGTLDDQDEAKPLILVVEDDPKAIDLLSTYLREGGFRVAVARSGEETLAKTRALRPLAITLDILFPTVDGWEILQELKGDPATREVPVLVVSIVDDRPRGLRLGAMEYLVKPVTKEALLATLARLGIPLSRLEPMQVLAIDDDPMTLEFLKATLHKQGLSLLTAPDGLEGIRLARMEKPDLIILDLMMPGMTGFEVVEQLRADPATADIPIIICSAKILTAPDRELLAGKVEEILQKGTFEPRELLHMVAEVQNRKSEVRSR
ncbi:MAG: GAF domain-containing protein [Candidatus Methylomirabilales bacterium]